MTENTQKIYYLEYGYHWASGTLVKTNRKTYKVAYTVTDFSEHLHGIKKTLTKNVKKEKCAFPDEKVCVVQEWWRGPCGGAHRVERELYPQYRVPANQVSRDHCDPYGDGGRVDEHDEYGVCQYKETREEVEARLEKIRAEVAISMSLSSSRSGH